MRKFVLAQITFGNDGDFYENPLLYCRAKGPVLLEGKDTCSMRSGTYSFLSYFNAFSTEKWLRFTKMRDLFLHLEYQGEGFEIEFEKAFVEHGKPKVQSGKHELPEAENWIACDFRIPLEGEILVAPLFRIAKTCSFRNVHYFTEIEDNDISPVDLAVAMTTFRKESYVLSNIQKFTTLLEQPRNDNGLSEHFHVHIVDNGRTLPGNVSSSDAISIHPNKNVGGSGGFARGMIEALEHRSKPTHILLMDDDVTVSPESLRRTFNLLSIVKEEYRSAFVSGAMLDRKTKVDQWEDIGYVSNDGFFCSSKGPLNLTKVDDLIDNEVYAPSHDHCYAGWWYCCIPSDTVRQHGLPLPLFVRGDDVEYSLRCQPCFITLAGICVWHDSFNERYNAAVERYQTVRNSLIMQAVLDLSAVDFLHPFKHGVQIETKKLNYDDALLSIQGLEDYLEGPDFLITHGGEESFLKATNASEKLADIENLPLRPLDRYLDKRELNSVGGRTIKERLLDLITGDRTRLPKQLFFEEPAVIAANGWIYPERKVHRRRTVIAVDPFQIKANIRKFDRSRHRAIKKQLRRSLRKYRARNALVEAKYQEDYSFLTSTEFWKNYLGLCSGD